MFAFERAIAVDSVLPEAPDKGSVIGKATVRAADLLAVSGRELSQIVGPSQSTWSRIRKSGEPLRNHKEQDLALLFLRIFRSVDALVGGDSRKAQSWLRAENRHLRGVPLELMKNPTGLVHVAEYLDAMRGKV